MQSLDKQCPEPVTQGKLIVGFDDVTHTKDLNETQSTTRCAFTHSGGAKVCGSKTQSLMALDSTQTQFIAAMTAAKTATCI